MLTKLPACNEVWCVLVPQGWPLGRAAPDPGSGSLRRTCGPASWPRRRRSSKRPLLGPWYSRSCSKSSGWRARWPGIPPSRARRSSCFLPLGSSLPCAFPAFSRWKRCSSSTTCARAAAPRRCSHGRRGCRLHRPPSSSKSLHRRGRSQRSGGGSDGERRGPALLGPRPAMPPRRPVRLRGTPVRFTPGGSGTTTARRAVHRPPCR